MEQDEQLKTSINNLINDILNRLKEIQSKEIETIKKFYNYDDFISLINNEISEEAYEDFSKNIKINIEALVDKLMKISTIINNYKKNLDINWDNYNINYKSHLTEKLNSILGELNFNTINLLNGNADLKSILNTYNNFYTTVLDINVDNDILESFAFSDKNYIIFGKNGAGKTRLLNYIKTNYFTSNSFVIPSFREIRSGNLNNIRMDYNNTSNLENLFSNLYVYPNDILTLKIKDKEFYDLKNNNAFSITEDGKNIGKTYGKLKEIFNSLGLDRKIELDGDSNQFMLYNDDLGIEPYFIKDGSDGEKSIVLFVSYILLCPQNSFVFIDEPESHFNTALLNDLFDMLEKERNDIIFIYCTHNIDFIELRNSAKLIYLDKFDGKNWDLKEINSFEEISMQDIVNIIGTKKDILFIEGEKGNVDYKFYSNLFPNFKVIPVSSCDKVINNCKSINSDNFFNLNRKAYGIIDNDFRNDEEIEKYLDNNIYTLPYNEIENLLLSSYILEYICNHYSLIAKMEKFKEEIINKAIREKNGIIQDYINKMYYRTQKCERLKYNGDLDHLTSQIDNLCVTNKNEFVKKLKNFIINLNKSLNDRNYDEIIKNYPNKGFLSCLSQLDIKDALYITWVIELVNKDDNFRNIIIENAFNYFLDKN